MSRTRHGLDLTRAAERMAAGLTHSARDVKLLKNEQKFGPEVWGLADDGDRDAGGEYWRSRK